MTTLQSVRPIRASRRPSVSTLAIVGALHIGVIYALYLGLTNHWNNIAAPKSPIDVTFVKDKTPPTPLPVSHVKLVDPTIATEPPPVIKIDPGDKHGGLTTVEGPPNTTTTLPPPPVIVAAQGITSTHTIPAYPAIDVRLNHTGNVLLQITIDERGYVTAANVEKSSGYETLDNAAVAWVIAHWRYQPATKDDKPMPSTTTAVVTFRLTGG